MFQLLIKAMNGTSETYMRHLTLPIIIYHNIKRMSISFRKIISYRMLADVEVCSRRDFCEADKYSGCIHYQWMSNVQKLLLKTERIINCMHKIVDSNGNIIKLVDNTEFKNGSLNAKASSPGTALSTNKNNIPQQHQADGNIFRRIISYQLYTVKDESNTSSNTSIWLRLICDELISSYIRSKRR